MKMGKRKEGIKAKELAAKFNCSTRTIVRMLSVDRADYLSNSLTQSKPWEAEGISRATWYRHGKTYSEASK